MGSRPSTFRQRDVTAAVKAVERAGKNVARVEVDGGGTIAIYVGGGNKPVVKKSTLERLVDAHDEEASVHRRLDR